MTQRKAIVPKGMEAVYDRFHYAPAMRAGNLLFISGQVGRNEATLAIPDEAEAQITLAFENLKTVLAEGGATFGNLVEMVSYHVDIRDTLRTFVAVKDRYVSSDFPAWTAIGVAALAHPKFKIEIKCVALLP
ncbi:MAG TPA: RidA family protein [Candidatus Cybelea sp.]|nr:RidA family protein [Candidatus Cybelea sp.]